MKKPFLLIVLFILLVAIGCQQEQYEPIPRETSVLLVVHVLEQSLSIFDQVQHTEIATWEFDFPLTGAFLLPDHETVMLYGKEMEQTILFSLTEGKLVDKWQTGFGVVNALLSKDEQYIYLADQDRDSIRIYTLHGKLEKEIKVGADPFTMILNAAGDELFVLNFREPSISVIDVLNQHVQQSFPAPPSTVGVALLEELNEIWIGAHGEGIDYEENVTVYSLTTGEVKELIYTPIMPIDFAYLESYVYVLSHGSNSLYQVDAERKEVQESLVIGANPFHMATHSNLLYIASYDSDEITIVNPLEMKVVETIQVGAGPFQILFREGLHHEA